MTIAVNNEEPDIVLGGDGPAPSAPPASASMTGAGADGFSQTETAGLLTAIATPVSLPTASAPPPIAAAAIVTTTSSGGNIERTTDSDGSLSVKITTTTPQPNGYREVRVEYFHIPSGMASAVSMSLDNGDPPSSLYMTKMEQQILPPGTGAVMSRPPATTTSAYPNPGHTSTAQPSSGTPHYIANNGSSSSSSGNICLKRCGLCCGLLCLVFIILVIAGAVSESNSHSSSYTPPSYTPPSYTPPSYTPPTPSWPPWPSPSWPKPHYTPSVPTPQPNPPSPTISPRPTTSPRPTYPSRRMAPFTHLFPPTPTAGKMKVISSPTGPPSSSPVEALPKSDSLGGGDRINAGDDSALEEDDADLAKAMVY